MFSPSKKLSVVFLTVCLLVAHIPFAMADTITLTVTGPDGAQQYTSSTFYQTITISKGGSYSISSSSPSAQAYFSIDIDAPGEEITLELNGVNIYAKASGYPGASAIRCYEASKVTITTAAGTENILEGTYGGSGIYIGDNCGDVILSGSGKLSAYGNSGGKDGNTTYPAGIRKPNNDSKLIIESGTIEAYGAQLGAGIGGSYYYQPGSNGGSATSYGTSTSNIIFKGGNVIAASAENYILTPPIPLYAKGVGNGGSTYQGNSNIIIAPASGTTITVTTKNIRDVEQWSAQFIENTENNITNNLASGLTFQLTSIVVPVAPLPDNPGNIPNGPNDPTENYPDVSVSSETLPKTGDESPVEMLLMLMMVSGILILSYGFQWYKQNQKF